MGSSAEPVMAYPQSFMDTESVRPDFRSVRGREIIASEIVHCARSRPPATGPASRRQRGAMVTRLNAHKDHDR